MISGNVIRPAGSSVGVGGTGAGAVSDPKVRLIVGIWHGPLTGPKTDTEIRLRGVGGGTWPSIGRRPPATQTPASTGRPARSSRRPRTDMKLSQFLDSGRLLSQIQ